MNATTPDNRNTLGRQLMALRKSRRRCPFCLGELRYVKDCAHKKTPTCDFCQKTFWRNGPAEFNLTFRKHQIIGVSPIPRVSAGTENFNYIPGPKPVRMMAIDVQGTKKHPRYAVVVTERTGQAAPKVIHQETVTSLKNLRRLQKQQDCFTGDAADVVGFMQHVLGSN